MQAALDHTKPLLNPQGLFPADKTTTLFHTSDPRIAVTSPRARMHPIHKYAWPRATYSLGGLYVLGLSEPPKRIDRQMSKHYRETITREVPKVRPETCAKRNIRPGRNQGKRVGCVSAAPTYRPETVLHYFSANINALHPKKSLNESQKGLVHGD